MKQALKRSLFTALLCAPLAASANNLQISNVSLTNASGGQADIQFTMSWDNSWHESWTETGGTISITNWDAVWVFAKYRQNGGLWKHVRLNATGHTPAGGTAIEVADDGGGQRLGAFVHRAAAGSGTVTCPNMRLHWDLAAQGIASPADLDISVFGVEMVYIPEGAFYLGSGGDEPYHFYAPPDTTAPYLVDSEAPITIGTEAGNLHATGAITAGTIPAEFPKGFRAFYCMKYEITEGQYTGFLNHLDPTVAAPLFPDKAGAGRHTIAAAPGGGFESAAPDRACNYIGMPRILGYLDWAGLRPMTELEFEKACRGQKEPWINEMAWGNSAYTSLTGIDGTDGSGTETALPANANAFIQNGAIGGPVRAGIFASGSTTREQAGASYYGVMEMSGNVHELAISVSRTPGTTFAGNHGDGNEYTLPIGGIWPADGFAYGGRGGHYNSSFTSCRTSSRDLSDARPYFSTPGAATGGRGARTAP